MKKKILALGMILALVGALVVPGAVLAVPVDQTVTGTTVVAYTIVTPVNFGNMAVSTSKTITPVITASADASVAVTVADTTAAYVIDALETLVYKEGATTKITITEPGVAGPNQSYGITGSPQTMLGGDVWSLTATTGIVAAAWDDVVITITVSLS